MGDARWTEEVALAWVADCMRWRGRVLHGERMHWCCDWDELPVDDTTREAGACGCFERMRGGDHG